MGWRISGHKPSSFPLQQSETFCASGSLKWNATMRVGLLIRSSLLLRHDELLPAQISEYVEAASSNISNINHNSRRKQASSVNRCAASAILNGRARSIFALPRSSAIARGRKSRLRVKKTGRRGSDISAQ